jgi:hypothetical protein
MSWRGVDALRTRRNNTRQCEFIHAPTYPYGLIGRVEPDEVMIVIDERSSDVFVVTESGDVGLKLTQRHART